MSETPGSALEQVCNTLGRSLEACTGLHAGLRRLKLLCLESWPSLPSAEVNILNACICSTWNGACNSAPVLSDNLC